MSEWINTSERSPDNARAVLFVAYGETFFGCYEHNPQARSNIFTEWVGCDKWNCEPQLIQSKDVTLWTELPEPPQEESK